MRRKKNIIDRKNSIISYLLLLKILHNVYGIIDPEIIYGAYGKPQLKDFPNLFFNISHCSEGCICVVSECEIGVDIQHIYSVPYDVMRMVCCQSEMEMIQKSVDYTSDFIRIWTLKESIIKLSGLGIRQAIKEIDTTLLGEKSYSKLINNCWFSISSTEPISEECICLI